MKRLAGFAAVAAAVTLVLAGPASAQRGAPDLDIHENRLQVKADGPGFKVKMSPQGILTRIRAERFGIPGAGFPIQRSTQNLTANPNLRPFVCENGTYRIVSGTFVVTQRQSSTEARPAPYTPAFNNAFRGVITFVGTLYAVVTNESGERFHLHMTDLVHEVLTPRSFSSTAPVHAFIVDESGEVRDRASLVGRVNVDRRTGEAEHRIVDRGTCHQTANLNFGPGTDQSTVFGPFFVLPFNTTVVMR